jgi:hypothetical protein
MAKRDKNRSYNEWEDDWADYSEEDSKKEKEIDRRNKRAKKHIITEDWDDED